MTTQPEPETTERQSFGFEIEPSIYGRSGIIGRPTTSMAGNLVLEAGPPLAEGGWHKTLHIVLTPDEAREFVAAINAALGETAIVVTVPDTGLLDPTQVLVRLPGHIDPDTVAVDFRPAPEASWSPSQFFGNNNVSVRHQ